MSASSHQARKNVLLLEGIHPIAKENFAQSGYEVELLSTSLGEDELISKLKDFDIVGIRSKTKLTSKVLLENPHLVGIGCFCIGTDQVDTHQAKLLGIPVFNSPYSNTRSVAELVLAEIVALSRHLGDVNRKAHEGTWLKSAKGNFEVRGKVLGIVGYGHIGSQVSVLAEAFGLRVQYFDVVKKLPLGNARACDSLQELLSTSDFVTLHVPDTPETRNMMTAKELGQMKKASYLLNLSRGKVVDIEALAEKLEAGHIHGAAVDVYPKEPKSNKESFESRLQNIENVILTPHIGGSTEEAQENIGNEVSASVMSLIREGSTYGSVNFPIVAQAYRENSHRLINVHKNVPGVLGDINSIVSKHGVNILGQYLATDPDIGYLVMDMAEGQPAKIIDEVNELDACLRTRISY